MKPIRTYQQFCNESLLDLNKLDRMSPDELTGVFSFCIRDLDMVKELIRFGANIHGNDTYYGAIHYAAGYGAIDSIKFLLDNGATVNDQTEGGMTPLHMAILGQQYNTVKFLIDAGANLDAQDVDGNTPLHKAAGNLDGRMVGLLLKCGAQITIQNNDGDTPWDCASDYIRLDVPQLNPNATR